MCGISPASMYPYTRLIICRYIHLQISYPPTHLVAFVAERIKLLLNSYECLAPFWSGVFFASFSRIVVMCLRIVVPCASSASVLPFVTLLTCSSNALRRAVISRLQYACQCSSKSQTKFSVSKVKKYIDFVMYLCGTLCT